MHGACNWISLEVLFICINTSGQPKPKKTQLKNNSDTLDKLTDETYSVDFDLTPVPYAHCLSLFT